MTCVLHRIVAPTSLLLGALWLAPAGAAHGASMCQPFGKVGSSSTALVYQNNHYKPSPGSTQCIDVTDAEVGAFSIKSTDRMPTDGGPAGYPSVFMGCHWGACSDPGISQLPMQVSAIATAQSTWSVVPVETGAWDISYDIWFNHAATTVGQVDGGQPDGTEIMIWLDQKGAIKPASETGSPSFKVAANGIEYAVWIAPKGKAQGGFNKTWNIISFVATRPQSSVKLNLLPFFSFAMAQGMLEKSWWLIDVEAGFEPWQGSSGLASQAFSFHVTRFPPGAGGR